MAENDTLLVEHRTTTNAPPLEDPLTLDALLHPLSKDDFLRQHFRQRCVVIRGGGAERAATLFPAASAGDVEEVVENTASERVMAWVRTGGTVRTMDGLPPSRGTTARSIDVEDPRSAVALHQAGHALYCRAPPGIEETLVNALLKETSLGLPPVRDAGPLSGRGEVEMFCARKGHVTAWHSDFQENFTVQLRGRKRWRLSQRREAHPLRATTPHFADDSVLWDQAKARALGETLQSRKRPRAAPGVEEVTLEAGDVLYFPAGVFHEVESLDDDNISLNISLMAPTTAEVICSALRHRLLRTDEGRARVTTNELQLCKALHKAGKELDALKLGHLLPGALLASPGDGNMSEDSEDESDDIPTFDVAENDPDWLQAAKAKTESQAVSVNPLYSLTTQEQLGDRTRGGHDRWVLVCGNYAGNDELEPAVRVRLVMPKGTYMALKKVIASGDWASLRAFGQGRALCGYLVHFGYLVLE
jgi:hypothetical protein